jgi:hypothetical protein
MCDRQRAIKRYFDNKPSAELVQPSNVSHNGPPSGSETNAIPLDQGVLAAKYWGSQQVSTSVTGKYLGPMCEAIPGPTGLDPYSD